MNLPGISKSKTFSYRSIYLSSIYDNLCHCCGLNKMLCMPPQKRKKWQHRKEDLNNNNVNEQVQVKGEKFCRVPVLDITFRNKWLLRGRELFLPGINSLVGYFMGNGHHWNHVYSRNKKESANSRICMHACIYVYLCVHILCK